MDHVNRYCKYKGEFGKAKEGIVFMMDLGEGRVRSSRTDIILDK